MSCIIKQIQDTLKGRRGGPIRKEEEQFPLILSDLFKNGSSNESNRHIGILVQEKEIHIQNSLLCFAIKVSADTMPNAMGWSRGS